MDAAGPQNTGDKRITPAFQAQAGRGRPKGVPNKSTATMKAAIQSVYDKLQTKRGGDHAHFLEWAESEPTEFYKLAAKLIPVQLTGEDGGAIKIAEVRRVICDPKAGK